MCNEIKCQLNRNPPNQKDGHATIATLSLPNVCYILKTMCIVCDENRAGCWVTAQYSLLFKVGKTSLSYEMYGLVQIKTLTGYNKRGIQLENIFQKGAKGYKVVVNGFY